MYIDTHAPELQSIPKKNFPTNWYDLVGREHLSISSLAGLHPLLVIQTSSKQAGANSGGEPKTVLRMAALAQSIAISTDKFSKIFFLQLPLPRFLKHLIPATCPSNNNTSSHRPAIFSFLPKSKVPPSPPRGGGGSFLKFSVSCNSFC